MSLVNHNGQPLQPQQPQHNGKGLNGTVQQVNGTLMYRRDGTPVVVGGDGVAIRGLYDFCPDTNRWAAKDTLLNLLSCAMKRPVATLGVVVLAWFVVQLAMGIAVGTVLSATGRARPVALGEIQKDSASQVGYWIGSSVAAPAAQAGAATLVNFADTAASQNATLVNFRQGGAQQNPLVPAVNGGALPSDTPLLQVVDGGQQR